VGPFDCAKCRQGYAKWGKLRKEADVRGVRVERRTNDAVVTVNNSSVIGRKGIYR
jgi:hypothetical protein